MATKRSKTKHPGLHKRFFSKIKQEYHDIDYINKLSEEDKEYLSSFMDEYLGANFTYNSKKIHKKKMYKTKSYNAHNARQRDIFSIERAKGCLAIDLDVCARAIESREDLKSPEDALIDFIDNKEEVLKVLKNSRPK
jgi:hypothetical protein